MIKSPRLSCDVAFNTTLGVAFVLCIAIQRKLLGIEFNALINYIHALPRSSLSSKTNNDKGHFHGSKILDRDHRHKRKIILFGFKVGVALIPYEEGKHLIIIHNDLQKSLY